MQRIAVTGCASRFAKALLPLLEADPNIEQIIGIDLLPPTGTFSKLVFHKQDIRDPRIKETLAIAAAAGLQVIEIPGEMVVQAVTTAWESGASAFGPEWLGEGTLICSNAKLKDTGTWTPRYTTSQAFAATVKALE
jgi:hypothetical protein